MRDQIVAEAAPAKLNLALHVTGRRADGYHLLDSLVGFAAFGDRVELSPGPLSLAIAGPFAAGLEDGEDNLCLRAARLAGGRAAITLDKRLPVASGVGGGSADAAAVLRGLARMGHPLPPAPERLGADVPVCLLSAPARMQGVGEVLTPLPALPRLPVVLVNPGIALPTPQVFAGLAATDNAPLPPIPRLADRAALIGWLAATRNDLEQPALALRPVIGEVLAALRGQGAGFARMSGSGATCLGLFDRAARAATAANALKQHGWWAVATELAPPLPPG
ncbi:4-(cytidine 5'-diphospho)-2-C-methyl-D-erythritol kinase [Paracoccus spongiarum]|uniref:4-diphosphocytidyl-2-C-methyl-D-erythritol kinase n=1 Tax=Paracoccus spongiarum TaxID=3064387 RepID=A0ABT9J9Y0_9RHOB|nr:4-(cytidine 5'-diphospho)-2-C-methyl-D-erythritol kinase [Paracoccus sp. 2205BS29-5]MDP5305896.1 4-(cytidine 5'-diphospho)-2-C-methyl-D-erythritol kinase [Paracoccus sp. 2205BS29-5]